MGLPELTFSLEKAAGTVSARMSAGAVALILRDAKDNGVYTIHRESDIPAQLGAAQCHRHQTGDDRLYQPAVCCLCGCDRHRCGDLHRLRGFGCLQL